ncbi:MAG: hypothetical protein ACFFB0_05415 [Promethearchaeota archaeon]
MSYLEGLTRNLIKKGYSKKQILERLVQEYKDFKTINQTSAFKLAKGILKECQRIDINVIHDLFIKILLDVNKANVSVGK